MRFFQVALLAVAALSTNVHAKLTPPVLPLVVRNPYLSTWLANAREAPWTQWPMFYTGEHIGLSVLAHVPEGNVAYPLLGRPQDSLDRDDEGYNVSFPIYLGADYDASTTNLTYEIPTPYSNSSSPPLKLVLSFLSPITPTSTLRQAIPASYLSVHVEGDFHLNLYVDLNGQWVSGDIGSKINWSFVHRTFRHGGNGLKIFEWQKAEQALLTEHADRAEWGSAFFTGPEDVHHEIGTSGILRQRFSRTGLLENTIDRNHRAILDEEPVFAFAKSFNLSKKHSSDSVLFTIAHVQDPVVQFAAARGLTFMRPLWASFFSSAMDLLIFHYFDFSNAIKLSSEYSQQLEKDALKSGAEDYVNIVALSARQVLGATSFSGTPENPILFLKEISSNGNFQTIDVIFPSFPFFLYTNPRWLAYLLEPLIEHTLSGQYPNDYAMHDLGAHFPNATGHPDGNDEYMPVEECGNILMMGLALVNSLMYDSSATAGSVWAARGSDDIDLHPDHSPFALTRMSADGGMMYIDDTWGGANKGLKQAQKWVKRSYGLWKQWTGYLVKYSLRPENQLCTDDFAGWLALQTNLALKGIIGIRAMSGIADVVGEEEDAKHYMKIAREYISKWEEYGISRDKTHAKLAYDWYGSWTTIYNIYGDSLLCFHLDNATNSIATPSPYDDVQQPIKLPGPDSSSVTGFVPHHIYSMQSRWYHAVRQRYGLPLDSRHLYTKTDWEFFAMAVTSERTRAEVLQSVAKWVNETVTDRPFTDLHETEGDGNFPGAHFFARPVIGGHFAFLTLERACGGKAKQGLAFLEAEDVEGEEMDRVRLAAAQFEGVTTPVRGAANIDL